MRRVWIGFLLLGPSLSAFSTYQQQLIPVIHETRTASNSSLSEWKTFVRVADYGGAPYVSLVQMADILNGQLRWHTVSKSVDFSIEAHTIRFPYYTSAATINGRRVRLEQPTVKNEEGFWVPISFFASEAFFRATQSKLVWPPPPEVAGVRGQGTAEKKERPLAVPGPPSPVSTHVIKRIVIDPGHGGRDPGAAGLGGAPEKDINLRLAQALADTLRETYGFEVLLTRMGDSFVPLEERAQLSDK